MSHLPALTIRTQSTSKSEVSACVVARHPDFPTAHPAFPAIDGVPADPPRRRSRRGWGHSSKFKSRKNGGRFIDCTSRLELCLAYMCEFDPEVLWYCEQPFTIKFRGNAPVRRYTPDMCVFRAGGAVIIETKTPDGVTEERWQSREPYIRKAFEALDLPFQVLTSNDLCGEPKLSNIRRRLEDRLRPVPDRAAEIIEYLAEVGPKQNDVVCRALGVLLFDLRVMVAHGLLHADLAVRFNEQTVVSC